MKPVAAPEDGRTPAWPRPTRTTGNFEVRVKSTSELPLAPSISAFNLSPWLGSLTDISFCSPLRFTV
jgi:hypothetical protein